MENVQLKQSAASKRRSMELSLLLLFLLLYSLETVVSIHYLDIGLVVEYKGFGQISLGHKPLLGDTYV